MHVLNISLKNLDYLFGTMDNNNLLEELNKCLEVDKEKAGYTFNKEEKRLELIVFILNRHIPDETNQDDDEEKQ